MLARHSVFKMDLPTLAPSDDNPKPIGTFAQCPSGTRRSALRNGDSEHYTIRVNVTLTPRFSNTHFAHTRVVAASGWPWSRSPHSRLLTCCLIVHSAIWRIGLVNGESRQNHSSITISSNSAMTLAPLTKLPLTSTTTPHHEETLSVKENGGF